MLLRWTLYRRIYTRLAVSNLACEFAVLSDRASYLEIRLLIQFLQMKRLAEIIVIAISPCSFLSKDETSMALGESLQHMEHI